MEKLQVFYKPYATLGFHKYLVYTSHDGVLRACRSGPDPNIEMPEKFAALLQLEQGKNPYPFLRTEEGIYQTGWRDHPIDHEEHGSETIVEMEDFAPFWQQIVREMSLMNAIDHQYHPTLQNSNTVVDAALENCGLPLPERDGWGKGQWWAPGSKRPLKSGRVEGIAISKTVPQEYIDTLKAHALRSGADTPL